MDKLLSLGDRYCLDFGSKRVQGEEYQAILKNPSTEIKLGILRCESGCAKHIHVELRLQIDD